MAIPNDLSIYAGDIIMAGFDNEVVYGTNVDFSGSTTVTAQITSNGQLLIGSAVAPNIRVSTLAAGSGISIANGQGSITISSSGVPVSITGIVAGTGSAYNGRTITAGTGISITNGNGVSGNPTISAVGGGLTWSTVTVDAAMTVNTGTVANKSGLLTMTLPATSAVGDMVAITGINTALGWKVGQNAGNQIFFGSSTTTSGTGGSLASVATHDTVTLVCVTANANWSVVSSIGNITVV